MEEKKYLDYEGLQTYHENLLSVLDNSELATAEALDDLDDRLKIIENKSPYSKSEIDLLLTPITNKLENIEEFAEVNVQSDWNQTDTNADDYIKNKPTIPSVGNAVIEILKNGTKVGSFTTNQSGSKVSVNITVPTGTAANKDVPTSGNASTSQVVMGNDSRLTDSRNAKDVYSWAKASSKPTYTASEVGAIPTSEKGAASGVATLDSAGKVPTSQLPSYVDDVLEYETRSAFPITGEGGKIYVDKSTNTTWRWSGSAYTQIKGDLVIGTTSGTAADGGTASAHYSNTSNPHSVTKSQVGLGSVVNTGDSATPVSGGTTKFTTGGAYTELAKKVDKESGKGLSTNDFTDTAKDKLDDLPSTSKAAASSGSDLSLVTTGEKYTWNNMLPLSGGTLTGNRNVLNIQSTDENAYVYFKNTESGTISNKASVGYYNRLAYVANENTYARIGVGDDSVPQYWPNAIGSAKHRIFHDGDNIEITVDKGFGEHAIEITNNSTQSFAPAFECFYPNCTTFNWVGGLAIGKYGSTNNSLTITYGYRAWGSTDNFLGIGFWSNDNIMTIYASRKTVFNSSVSATNFITTSDIRKKDIIDNLELDIEDIANAPIFKFTWLDPEMPEGVNVGTSAQYWQTILPEIVTAANDDEKTLSMQYGVAGLVSSVTLAKKVVEQEETIKAQEARIKALEDAIAEIQSKLNN